MKHLKQWFLWRLEWNATKGKYDKIPCALDGSVYRIDASLPENWHSYDDVMGCVREGYVPGFWLTPECGYWFLDIDNASASAQDIVARVQGCYVEWSVSGTGLHVIGRVPPGVSLGGRRTRPEQGAAGLLLPMSLEFYSEGRGIAFGHMATAVGDMECVHPGVMGIADEWFPERTVAAHGEGVHPDWRGPADDAELVSRMLASRQSAMAAFGGKPSLQQLWAGDAERNSESDMALAGHLAFWTGGDVERMVRLMWQSGLVRDKWRDHRTYLQMTCTNATRGLTTVYQDPRTDLVVVEPGSIEPLLDLVSGCGTVTEMHNEIIPLIRQQGLPDVFIAQLAGAIKRKLSFFDADVGLPALRKMLRGNAVTVSQASHTPPEWVGEMCYVLEDDKFFILKTGARLSMQGFMATYTRHMHQSENGKFENPADWALNRWGMRTVGRLGYRPDRGEFFEQGGVSYVNTYSPASLPPIEPYDEVGLKGIEQFQLHLWDMCSRREEVYYRVLWWFAHNVQFPGVKIRWSPIIKGTQGDGKSLLSNVLRAAMGVANVNVTGNSTLTNSGGFNDWAVKGAVNVIEEIWLIGRERHKLYNATKEFITNDLVNINPKGKQTYMVHNPTNHIAFSNHNDAIPLESEDRRWLVVFTPWADRKGMFDYCGLTETTWNERTKAIDKAWRECPGQLRAWLLSLQIGEQFDKDGSAMVTHERGLMVSSSKDDVESIALSIIMEGANGIHQDVFSSNVLGNLLRARAIMENYEMPKGQNLNHMLTRMGYSKLEQRVKWNGLPHTIWIKNGIRYTNDEIRYKLENKNPM